MKSIIIADDSSTARMIIKRCLVIAGCLDADFLEAGNGAEALEIARNNQVDMLVTDLNMPNMDGKSLLRHVKASPRLNDIPVLVITSACNPVKETELLKLGAFAVISKPISPASVAQALQSLTKQNEWGES